MTVYYTTAPVQSELWMKKILYEFYNLRAPDFFKNENGKPYLAGNPLSFNLSHSGNLTALAIAQEEIGLDVQLRDGRPRKAILRRLTPAERQEDFFKVWTAKESYIKYRGQTLAALFNKLTFKRDTLFLNGNPLSETLCFSELEGCTVCICTRTPHSARFVKV